MEWNEFNADNDGNKYYPVRFVKTNIHCPKCGVFVNFDSQVVLTSYPAKYMYMCPMCGWSGTSFKSWRR